MAKYRQIHTSFWGDGFVLDLTPEEKYFYLYLMTNPKTTQCGIYELPKKIIETHTGYNRETVDKLLQRFVDYKKIDYFEGTKEIMLLNWIKYNPPNNTNAIKCIASELQEVKCEEFINRYLSMFQEYSQYDMKGLIRGYEGAYKGLPSNRVISNKEEVISKEEEAISKEEDIPSTVDNFQTVIKVFEENIHPLTPLELDKLIDWCKDVEPGVVIAAISESVTYNKRSMGYINAVLNNWIKTGIKTMQALEAYKRDKTDSTPKGNIAKVGSRTYDVDKLEKALLGRGEGET